MPSLPTVATSAPRPSTSARRSRSSAVREVGILDRLSGTGENVATIQIDQLEPGLRRSNSASDKAAGDGCRCDECPACSTFRGRHLHLCHLTARRGRASTVTPTHQSRPFEVALNKRADARLSCCRARPLRMTGLAVARRLAGLRSCAAPRKLRPPWLERLGRPGAGGVLPDRRDGARAAKFTEARPHAWRSSRSLEPVSREAEDFNRRLLRARDAMDRAYAEPLNIRTVAAVANVSAPLHPELPRRLRRNAASVSAAAAGRALDVPTARDRPKRDRRLPRRGLHEPGNLQPDLPRDRRRDAIRLPPGSWADRGHHCVQLAAMRPRVAAGEMRNRAVLEKRRRALRPR